MNAEPTEGAAPGPATRGEPGADEHAGASGPLLDPGWLFLLSGLVLLAATVLIPARRDLDEASEYLERAKVVEQHRLDRIERYVGYMNQLDAGDEGAIMALAAMQINQAPEGNVLLLPSERATRTPSIFSQLEPPPMELPERRAEASTLEAWCLADRSRLMLTGLGALLVLIGLLPPTIRK